MRHFIAPIFLLNLVCWAQVTLHPTDDVPRIVSSKPPGTTFLFTPGTYRLYETIKPKDNDKFIGTGACAPPTSACPAIITGAVEIGSLATFDGVNYAAAKQPQHGGRGVPMNCEPGWPGCIYPEDLFFNGVPYQHLDAYTLPEIGHGQWWFDYTNRTIYFHDNPAGHTVETSALNSAFSGPANNVTIQYLTIKQFANMYPFGAIGGPQGANALTQGAHWTVQDCEVMLNHGAGVRVGYGIQILDNYIHDNGQVGIGGGIGVTQVPSTESVDSGILIQGNTITHNDYAHFNPGFGSGGVKVGATSGIVLRGNAIEQNEGSGIHFDAFSLNELVDGNTITDNSDSDGLVQEIGYGLSIFRNNLLLRNGVMLNSSRNTGAQVAVRASAGVESYCNVLEVPSGLGVGAWGIGSAGRGQSSFPPFQYLATTENSFHHNTVIWDPGATGVAGFLHNDPARQPDFFAKNPPPDYNSYHLPSPLAPFFVYDNDNSRHNQRKTFADYQRSRADIHGTADANNASGFPDVAITSPVDQSSFAGSVTVRATATDKSGISKVEFYVDWNLEATVKTSPYDFNWTNAANGSHTVAAMAYSNAGIHACYAVTLIRQ